MAGAHTEQGKPTGATGTNGPRDPALASPAQVAAKQRVEAHRRDTLAALLEGGDEIADDAAGAAASEDTADEVESTASDPDEDESPVDEERREHLSKPEAKKPEDPEAKKRLAAVNEQERRAREKIQREREEWKAQQAKERAALERDQAEWRERMETAQRFEKLRAKAKLDPAAALEALGVDDFEYAAKQAYARAKGATDPAHRETAARMQLAREHSEEIAETRRELKELKEQLHQRDKQAEYQAAWQGYLGDVTKTATADTSEAPLLRAQLAKNPARAEAAIREVAADLYQRTGEWPDAQDVITAYEKRRREELEELGIDVATIGKTKPPSQAAGKQKPARTLGNDLSHAREPRPPKSAKEQRAETLALLEAGNLDA